MANKGYTAGMLTHEAHIEDLAADQLNNAIVFARVARLDMATAKRPCSDPQGCANCDYLYNCAVLDEAEHYRLVNRYGLIKPRKLARTIKRLLRGRSPAPCNKPRCRNRPPTATARGKTPHLGQIKTLCVCPGCLCFWRCHEKNDTSTRKKSTSKTAPTAKKTATKKTTVNKPITKPMQSKKTPKPRYAVMHKDGILVRGLGSPFINFAGDFDCAMTFGSESNAQDTAKYINEQSRKMGGPGTAYTVIEKSKYKKPKWLTQK